MAEKEHLRLEIINLFLWHGTLDRPGLIRETGARAATVFKVIDGLKKTGLLAEPDRIGFKTGRRAPHIELNSNRFWTLGVDFQADRVIGVLVNLKGEIIDSINKPAGPRGTPDACCDEIREVVNQLRRQNAEDWGRVKGLGFADPGLIDSVNGISLRAVNIPGWANIKTSKWLASEFDCCAYIWPECMIKTHMEYLSRYAGVPPESLFHISLGEGIGGGFVKGGECFAGANNCAMEIGHVIVAPDGPLCQCGNRGCLEALAGLSGIKRKVREVIDSGIDTELSLDDFTLEHFIECAHRDKAARIIAEGISAGVGLALAIVVTLLNPAMIILSGKTTALGDLLKNDILRTLNANCFSGSLERLQLEFSSLGPQDTARGAAILMRNKILQI